MMIINENKDLEYQVMRYKEQCAELEQENAELKEKYAKNITDCDICDTYCNSQLTKAKEIIKKLIDLVDFLNEDNVKEPIIAEAEQFLNEVEKNEEIQD